MHVVRTALPGVLLIEPTVHRDARGFFVETYHADRYRAHGVVETFLQDNHSRSLAGTVRGLHIQTLRPQAKLIRAVAGEIYDVVVDLRRGSPTFGRWHGAILSADNFRQCYVPGGFAHGFAVRTAVAEVEYKCSEVYDPAGEIGIAWDDPELAIDWGVSNPILSDRDRQNPTLAAVADRLPIYQA